MLNSVVSLVTFCYLRKVIQHFQIKKGSSVECALTCRTRFWVMSSAEGGRDESFVSYFGIDRKLSWHLNTKAHVSPKKKPKTFFTFFQGTMKYEYSSVHCSLACVFAFPLCFQHILLSHAWLWGGLNHLREIQHLNRNIRNHTDGEVAAPAEQTDIRTRVVDSTAHP